MVNIIIRHKPQQQINLHCVCRERTATQPTRNPPLDTITTEMIYNFHQDNSLPFQSSTAMLSHLPFVILNGCLHIDFLIKILYAFYASPDLGHIATSHKARSTPIECTSQIRRHVPYVFCALESRIMPPNEIRTTFLGKYYCPNSIISLQQASNSCRRTLTSRKS